MTVSKRLRFEVLRRDNHQCRYCGAAAPKAALTVDHVVPVTLGGGDEPANLVAACKDCNAGKSSVPADAVIVEDVTNEAMRWAAAMKQVAEMRSAELDAQFQMLDWFMSVWNEWTNWRGDPYDAVDAVASIPQFMKAGLTTQELEELVAVAMKGPARDKWRYFCGCCWKRIRQNQELAAEIVAGNAGPDQDGLPEVAVRTRWTQEGINEHLNVDEPLLQCEDHNDGECGDDLLCRIVCAARTREMQELYFVRDWKAKHRAETIDTAADDAEEYIHG